MDQTIWYDLKSRGKGKVKLFDDVYETRSGFTITNYHHVSKRDGEPLEMKLQLTRTG